MALGLSERSLTRSWVRLKVRIAISWALNSAPSAMSVCRARKHQHSGTAQLAPDGQGV